MSEAQAHNVDPKTGAEGVGAADDEAAAAVAAGGAADNAAADKGAEKKGAAATVAGGAGGDGGEDGAAKAGKGDDTDWRDAMARGDAKLRKQLDRYATQADVGKKMRELERKLSSGEYLRALPEGADEAEVAAWRKERGIPDKPEGYLDKLELGKGHVIGEDDKPVVNEFGARAIELGLDQKQFSGVIAKYYELQDAQALKREEDDGRFHEESVEKLRDEMGKDYKPNINALNNLVAEMPEGLGDRILLARTPDGRLLGDDAAFISWWAGKARELNPAATLVPNASGNPAKSVEARLEEISKLRREDPDKFDHDKTLQAEERELLDAQLKMQNRGRAA